ncbi:MAG TPA: lantibiotic dehydratase [Polyangiaceae bacterium]|nr:lantibiotic dehydratase [Polyangiaceae bacterium]
MGPAVGDGHAPETRALSYHLVSVERTPYLDATLEAAARGASGAELAAAIVASDPELTLDEAEGYIADLVESQILVSPVAPPITGGEPVRGVLETLRACEGGQAAAAVLAAADDAIRAIDEERLGVAPSRYRDVAHALAPLPAKPELARLFQVDLYKPVVHAELGEAVLRELTRGVGLLARIAPAPVDDALARFRDAFVERYEAQTIPLTLALDEEAGIGFRSGAGGGAEPSPLMQGLELPPDPAPPSVPFGPREQHMLRRLAEVGRARAMEWRLDERDLEALSSKLPPRLPAAFAVTATLAAASRDALERDEFRVSLQGVSGPSGAVLLGRFCHGDAGLRSAVLAHLAAEEAAQPDAIFAEIVHLPEGRLGNILCRPALRRWEIPYHGRSGAAEAQQIAVSDLRIRVEAGRILLSSERLGREVIPRLTSAHNWSTAAQGIYRFLCALQHQGRPSLGFSWGALGSAPFLPRVTHGRLVLALARWNLAADQLAPLGEATGAERYRVVQRLRAELGLPRWVGVADGDNVLPVDLDNVLHVESFARLLKSRESAALVELWGEDALVAESAEGRFVHELVVPFIQEAEARPSRPVVAATEAPPRRFVPGSEWLYAKLYTGTASADAILKEVIAPLLASARSTSGLERWFFIRYGDPHWHLRVRFKGAPAALGPLREAAEVLLADGRLWKLGLDTYEREVERYGGPDGIELCEAIFEADSDAALGIVERLEADEGADARWRLALRGMHLLLVDLGLDLRQRIELLRGARASFGAEHRVDVAFERALGKKFRSERAALEALLSCPVGTDHPLDAGFALLEERSERIAPIAAELRAREGRLTANIPQLASSLLHMHANRLVRSDARAHELVFYDFLLRLYASEVARSPREG